MVMRYARASRRALVVDWRDAKWARDAGFDFEDFFTIRGLQADRSMAWKLNSGLPHQGVPVFMESFEG